jgi:hypothetical protein
LGDVNLDLLNTSNTFVSQYSSIVSSNDFTILNKCTPRFATRVSKRVSRTTSTILDHAITNINDHFPCKLDIAESHLSDHKYLLLNIAIPHSIQNVQLCKSIINFPMVSESLHLINLDPSNFDKFHEDLVSLIRINTLQSVINITPSKPKNPWYSSKLKKINKRLKKAYKLFKKFPLNSDFRLLYFDLKVMLKKAVLKSKIAYFSDQFHINKDNPSNLWKMTRQLSHNTFSRPPKIIHSIKSGNQTIEAPLHVANHFNEVFVNAGEKATSGSTDPFSNTPRPFLLSSLNIFAPTNISEVSHFISKLSNSSSPGYDKIQAKFLKENSEMLSGFLSEAINYSFINGVFPKSLKFALVTPYIQERRQVGQQ